MLEPPSRPQSGPPPAWTANVRERVSVADEDMLGRPLAVPSSSEGQGSDKLAFFKGFLERPAQVASVVPSSSRLEAQIVQAAELAGVRSVVELGPGTGGTTRALLRSMAADARLLAIELNPKFHARISARLSDARLIAQYGSAEQIEDHLRRWNLPPPEVVVSGIPFSAMPAATAERIAAVVASALAPGGRMVAYQVRSNVARFLSPHLGLPSIRREWMNIPPMRVFTWTKR
jgi:phosphatidylethanolamine/phosphatidyl-N-methylethanolamine N-methyltransferase